MESDLDSNSRMWKSMT